MVRIFAAGDFHGDRSTAWRLSQEAVNKNADLIILNGDIVEDDAPEGVMKYFVATGKPVFLVPGNHDWFATDFLAAQYRATNLHGKHSKVSHVGLVGCGGTNAGINMMTESEIYGTIKETDAKLKDIAKKVLVTHIHPAGSLMENFSSFVKGSVGLRKAIEATKPDVVICGHVHEAEGIEEKIGKTLVVNVGKSGKLIEL
ncbi:metallophosphoesterase [Candidatus Woesearchaeota archaeon]|nr:metallophosphoesterase [Candidatus Woesearchaeota archaeon]